jgi:hypothetical protein
MSSKPRGFTGKTRARVICELTGLDLGFLGVIAAQMPMRMSPQATKVRRGGDPLTEIADAQLILHRVPYVWIAAIALVELGGWATCSKSGEWKFEVGQFRDYWVLALDRSTIDSAHEFCVLALVLPAGRPTRQDCRSEQRTLPGESAPDLIRGVNPMDGANSTQMIH